MHIFPCTIIFSLQACVMEGHRIWHLEHFKCCECKKPIGENGFHEHDEKIYCTADYKKLFLPKCPECKDYVTDFVVNKKWHPNCFRCAVSQFRHHDVIGFISKEFQAS